MFNTKMKPVICILALLVSVQVSAQQGPDQSSDQDASKASAYTLSFPTVDDLVQWLLQGDAKGVQIPQGISLDQYKISMFTKFLQYGWNPGGAMKSLMGTETGNGGDTACELRFKNVRDDIALWILKHGADDLKLPDGLSLGQYKAGMLQNILEGHVQCVTTPVMVNGAEKTCRNYVNSFGKKQVECNFDRYTHTTEDEQYRLGHHEYAGLAGFEVNSEDDSHYFLSDQITSYLEVQSVKKLVVKQVIPFDQDGIVKRMNAARDGVIDDISYSTHIVPTKFVIDSIQEGKDKKTEEKSLSFRFLMEKKMPMGQPLRAFFLLEHVNSQNISRKIYDLSEMAVQEANNWSKNFILRSGGISKESSTLGGKIGDNISIWGEWTGALDGKSEPDSSAATYFFRTSAKLESDSAKLLVKVHTTVLTMVDTENNGTAYGKGGGVRQFGSFDMAWKGSDSSQVVDLFDVNGMAVSKPGALRLFVTYGLAGGLAILNSSGAVDIKLHQGLGLVIDNNLILSVEGQVGYGLPAALFSGQPVYADAALANGTMAVYGILDFELLGRLSALMDFGISVIDGIAGGNSAYTGNANGLHAGIYLIVHLPNK